MGRTLCGTGKCIYGLSLSGPGRHDRNGVGMSQTAQTILAKNAPPTEEYDREIACPWCESKDTRLVSPYGPSAAEMMFKCL
ncbi:MAG: hypothetical protein ACR2RD_11645, partial [Woeseiaceae bacterium]